MLQLVKFTTSYGAYRGGETAGFSAAEAARLVDLGVASLVVAKGKQGKAAGAQSSEGSPNTGAGESAKE